MVKSKNKGYKFAIDFFLILLILLSGVIGYIGFFQVQKSCDTGIYEAVTTAALEVQSYVKRAEGHMGLYLSLGGEADKDKFYARVEAMNENIKILEKYIASENDLLKLQRIKDASISFEDTGKLLIDFYDQNPSQFEPSKYDYLLNAIRSSAFIIRENSVALAQSSVVNSAIGVSSSIKQAESYLLLLYLNLGDIKYKQSYFENLEDVRKELFILETDVVPEGQREYVNTIRTSMETIEEKGAELISAYESNPTNFDAKDYEKIVRDFHDASSLIRETAITLAKEELEVDRRAAETPTEINFLKYVFIGVTTILLFLFSLKVFVKPKKK